MMENARSEPMYGYASTTRCGTLTLMSSSSNVAFFALGIMLICMNVAILTCPSPKFGW